MIQPLILITCFYYVKLKEYVMKLVIDNLGNVFSVDTAVRATRKCAACQIWPAGRGLWTAVLNKLIPLSHDMLVLIAERSTVKSVNE